MNLIKTDGERFYYFDRLVINTDKKLDELKDELPIDSLRTACSSLWIGEAWNTAKYWGYQSKIDATDVTEEFVDLLRNVDLGHCGISSIEITMDVETETFKEAEEIQFRLERNLYRKWERNRWTWHSNENDTNYIGTKFKVNGNNYLVMYPVPEDESPFTNRPVFHMEFKLRNWNKMQKILGIAHFSELGKAEDVFKLMQNRYLPEKEINRELLRKKLIKNGVDPVRAKYRSEMLSDIQDLREWIDRGKDQVRRKKNLQSMRRKYQGRAPIINKWDKFIMGLSVGQFLSDKR